MDSDFTQSLEDVIEQEHKQYLAPRRINTGVDKDAQTWGIAFSGGGIRSATFCLGVIQSLTKAGLFKFFDYMSTVSGGGYIGSCLSSLLSHNNGAGVDAATSPFVGLHSVDPYEQPEKTRLSVRHQMHHLRARGNYLSPDKAVVSRDAQRLVGTFSFGAIYHIVLFSIALFAFTALLHSVVSMFIGTTTYTYYREASRDSISLTTIDLAKLGYIDKKGERTIDSVMTISSSWDVLQSTVSVWWKEHFYRSIAHLYSRLDLSYDSLRSFVSGSNTRNTVALTFNSLGAGMLFGILALVLLRLTRYKIVKVLQDESSANHTSPLISRLVERSLPGVALNQSIDIKHSLWFNILSFFIPLALLIAVQGQWINEEHTVIVLPLVFAIGAYIATFIVVLRIDSRLADKSRITRSLHAFVKGALAYGVSAAILIPVLLVFMFSLSFFSSTFYLSVLLALASAFLFSKGDPSLKIPVTFLEKNYKLLLNTAVILFLFTAISSATPKLLLTYGIISKKLHDPGWAALMVSAASFGVIAVITYLVDINKVSAHSFYGDRLSEAYLMTEARVQRPQQSSRQGMPLITLRDDEDMKMHELGGDHPRAPYHLITIALNMRGSEELSRKTLKSDHFLMSKFWVGSRSTGYVRTNKYHLDAQGNPRLRLATAMTISAAAFNSMIGFRTFLAQSLLATVLNIRLGYWIENPWKYRPVYTMVRGKEKYVSKPPKRSHIWWGLYLLREVLGKTTAGRRMVYLSDGGHTGDNLGLLPLFQRRCKVIFVVDAEADHKYEFDSFNNAVRLAYTEENIQVEIDLTPIIFDSELTNRGRTTSDSNELVMQQRSFAVGVVRYPALIKNVNGEQVLEEAFDGALIYLKASCSEWRASDAEFIPSDIQELIKDSLRCTDSWNSSDPYTREFVHYDEQVPVTVQNYNRSNAMFPHQSTGDQFFDTSQFEAYRALGEHVAKQAVVALAGVSRS